MVLFVDDDEEMTDVVVQTLHRIGYSALAVNDPVHALAVFSSAPERFDAVIVDEIMPVMRGTELARQLIRIKDDLPILLLTGYGGMIPAEEARSSGIRGTLMKPVHMEELKAILQKLSIPMKSDERKEP